MRGLGAEREGLEEVIPFEVGEDERSPIGADFRFPGHRKGPMIGVEIV